jgi:transposase
VLAATKTTQTEELIQQLRSLLEAGKPEEVLLLVAALLTKLHAENAELAMRLNLALRASFKRSSEKLDDRQLELLQVLAAAAPEDAEPPAPLPEPPPKPEPRRKNEGHPGRRPLPKHLPRVVIEVPVPEEARSCICCGQAKVCIGHEETERLDYTPAQFRVIVERREKLACKPCNKDAVTAPALPCLVPGGCMATTDMIAHVVVSKICDHVPLARQANILKRHDIDIPESTLLEWYQSGIESLAVLAKLCLDRVLASYIMHCDDTGIAVLDRDTPRGVKRGHLWACTGDGQWAAYFYTPDWKASGMEAKLKDRVGYLVVDGYGGFERLFRPPGRAIHIACWMHARREFVRALEAKEMAAATPLELIRQIYEVEARANQLAFDEAGLLALRQARSRPLYDQLGAWLLENRGRHLPKSRLGKAIGYALARWQALGRFLDDVRIPLDNGAAERAIRPIALGRNNYLFAGSDRGGQHLAIGYTLVATCKLQGVEPFAYLRSVLAAIADGSAEGRLADFLPDAWAKRQAEKRAEKAGPVDGV